MSVLPAYTSSRTPVLDEQLASISRGELALSADEAHRLAGSMLDDRAPLRTPVLDERLVLARHEFGDPTYVEAVIRSFAALPLNVCYSDEQLERIAGGDSGSIPDSTETIASAATRLKGNVMQIWHASSADSLDSARVKALDDLDERLHAFVVPFERIGKRFFESIPSIRDLRSLEACGENDVVPAHDYDSIARKVGLPPTATTRMLLRFCFIPTDRYVQVVRSMGSTRTACTPDKENSWLFATCLNYAFYGKRDASRARRIRRFTYNVLTPLALAGRPEPAPERTPTLFDLLPEGASR